MRASTLGRKTSFHGCNSRLSLNSARFYVQASAAQYFAVIEAYLFAVTGRNQRFWRHGIKNIKHTDGVFVRDEDFTAGLSAPCVADPFRTAGFRGVSRRHRSGAAARPSRELPEELSDAFRWRQWPQTSGKRRPRAGPCRQCSSPRRLLRLPPL